MTTLHLITDKPLQLPKTTWGELHIDEIRITRPRDQRNKTAFYFRGGFMDRGIDGRIEWANPQQDDRATVEYANNDLDAYMAANTDLSNEIMAAVWQLMDLMAKVMTRERHDKVGNVRAEIRQ